jgi:hypothetical protein
MNTSNRYAQDRIANEIVNIGGVMIIKTDNKSRPFRTSKNGRISAFATIEAALKADKKNLQELADAETRFVTQT